MPIYEYRCPQGHVFELLQPMGDPQPTVCEVCGEGPVERVLYPVAVHFKGSGFYSTDYGRGGRKKDSGSSEDGAGSADGDGGGGGAEKKKEKKEAAEA